jgi:GT2 family glycosyltransferase
MKECCSEKQSDHIDVSIVIVNWNTKDLLKNCLNSVYQTINNITFEIIVVDNASSDGSPEMLKRDFPQTIRICNSQNKGFGAANNQAFAVMQGKYALLLNTDALLTPEAVNKLWTFCEANRQAAIVCGQLLNADGSKQNSFASFPSLLTLITNTSLMEYLFPEKFPSKRYKHESPIEVDSAIGACMMIRKKSLDEAGAFDERYFFFFEETDLAYTIHQSGWKTYHIPDAYIYHLQGQSVGNKVRSRIEFYRSRYQFLRKWHSRTYYICASLMIFMRLLINWAASCVMTIFTLGLGKKIRQKFVVYSRLIFWHLKCDKQKR